MIQRVRWSLLWRCSFCVTDALLVMASSSLALSFSSVAWLIVVLQLAVLRALIPHETNLTQSGEGLGKSNGWKLPCDMTTCAVTVATDTTRNVRRKSPQFQKLHSSKSVFPNWKRHSPQCLRTISWNFASPLEHVHLVYVCQPVKSVHFH